MNPDCQHFQSALLESLGDGDAAARPAVRDHAATCPTCAAEAASLERLVAVIRASRVAPDPGLAERTHLRLQLHAVRLRRRRQALLLLVATSGLSLATTLAALPLLARLSADFPLWGALPAPWRWSLLGGLALLPLLPLALLAVPPHDWTALGNRNPESHHV